MFFDSTGDSLRAGMAESRCDEERVEDLHSFKHDVHLSRMGSGLWFSEKTASQESNSVGRRLIELSCECLPLFTVLLAPTHRRLISNVPA